MTRHEFVLLIALFIAGFGLLLGWLEFVLTTSHPPRLKLLVREDSEPSPELLGEGREKKADNHTHGYMN